MTKRTTAAAHAGDDLMPRYDPGGALPVNDHPSYVSQAFGLVCV
jgi:hypothetical protein